MLQYGQLLQASFAGHYGEIYAQYVVTLILSTRPLVSPSIQNRLVSHNFTTFHKMYKPIPAMFVLV